MPNIKGGLNLLKRALDPVQDKALPLRLPRARLAPEYIDQQADRVARQMLGEHVVSGKPKETFNLAGRSKKESDRVKNLEYKLKPIGTVAQETPYAPRKGDINVAVPGDQTISDTILESIEDTPIGSVQQGGARYGLGQKHLDEPEFWKSNEAPAKGIQGKVDRLQEMYEPERMIGSHLAMGQTANNFAMHFADANLRAIDWSKASPKKINVFDNIIAGGYKDDKTGERVYFPNWPGLADPDAAMLAMKEDSNLRKWFNNRMKVPSITKPLDLPNGLDIQYAITEPNIRDLEINMTGLMTGKLKPGALVEAAGNPHNTYTHRILGEAEGAQEVLTPFQISHPDAAAHIASTKRPSDFTGTIQKVFPHQLVDEQYLDDYGRYRERIKKLTGKKDGGSVDIKAADARLAAAMQQRMAKGGAVDIEAADARLSAAMAQRMAGGGLLKSAAKGVKRLFNDDVLPAAERDANLAKFLEGSAIKERVHHGTMNDVPKFSDKKLGQNTDANASSKGYAETARVGHWFNTQPMGQSPEKYGAGYSVDMPVHLSIKNPKREMNLDWLAQGLESKKGRTYRRELEKQGYDGMVLPDEEFGGESWVAFRPEQIKSAIGNRGTYDINEADITKATGGAVTVHPRVHEILNAPPLRMKTGGTVQRFDGGGMAMGEDSYVTKPERLTDIKKNAAEMYEDVKRELSRLKSPEARKQLAKIAAAQLAGGLPDLASMVTPLINSDAMLSAFPMQRLAKIGVTGTPSLGRRESVLSDETVPYSLADYTNDKKGRPIGGSEHIIRRAQDAGLMYGKDLYDEKGEAMIDPETGEPLRSGRFHPLMEIGASVLGGVGASKLTKAAAKGSKGKVKLTPIQANAKGGLSMASKVNFHPHRLTRRKL